MFNISTAVSAAIDFTINIAVSIAVDPAIVVGIEVDPVIKVDPAIEVDLVIKVDPAIEVDPVIEVVVKSPTTFQISYNKFTGDKISDTKRVAGIALPPSYFSST